MATDELYDAIIIGGGPAGLTAGLYCKRAALKTVLFEKGLPGGQIAISKEVENYPGLENITGFDLAEKMVHHAGLFGLDIRREEVSEIVSGAPYHAVRLATGERLRSRALILAAGGSVRKLGVPGEAEYLGAGVSYCATCDGFFFRDKTVIVVGGGDTAAEEALYLSKITRKVSLVHRGNTLRAGKILQDRLTAAPEIDFIWNTVVKEINGDGKHVVSVTCEDIRTGVKKIIPTDGVFVCIGYSPNNQLIPPGVTMNELGFVITDDRCETSVPGIFAVGDLRKKFANQIVVAAADGCIAALAAAHYVEISKGTIGQ